MTGFLAVLLPALLVLAGLAVDGADAISARERRSRPQSPSWRPRDTPGPLRSSVTPS